jgi:hypothetical protein
VDGVSLRAVLNGSVPVGSQVRSELWIADDVLRIGDWKLITGSAGVAGISGMLGLDGMPFGVPNDPKNLSSFYGSSKCAEFVFGQNVSTRGCH